MRKPGVCVAFMPFASGSYIVKTALSGFILRGRPRTGRGSARGIIPGRPHKACIPEYAIGMLIVPCAYAAAPH